MTRFDPSLIVKRMVIQRNGLSVYDEVFHVGVNVIRGDNSSGKSTILNFIHYALGGDVHEWSETALLCDRVYLEVKLNGKLATLARPVSEDPMQPMDIFFGNYDDAICSDVSSWQRYPYRRSPKKESFSQVLFRVLDIPEAANEDSGNITINQVMRLLYADQLSPIDEIFAHEGFDNAKIREAVGKLLCGSFDNELYANQLEIKKSEKRFDEVASELNSLYRALGEAGHDLTLGWVTEQRARNQSERHQLLEDIASARRLSEGEAPDFSLEAQESAYKELVDCQRRLAAVREEFDAVEYAIADSTAFANNLEQKLDALKEASLVAEEIGTAQFDSCPACYAEISEAVDGVCSLCKEPLDDEVALERIGGLINETALQLRQSKLLQEEREKEALRLKADLQNLKSQWEEASKRYGEVQGRPTSEWEQMIGDSYKRLGYLDRRDEDLNEKAKLIDVIDALSSEKSRLNEHLSRLKDRNNQLLRAQGDKLSKAYHDISEWTRSLISRDLKRQDSFENPKVVDFDFGKDKITVDGHPYFSASSRAILKSAFVFGFQAAAARNQGFRHPRFVMLDTIEDKGMEPARSKNFQRLMVETSEGAEAENQVIFATAMVDESLNNDNYTVGRFYTRDDRSLEIS